MFNVTRSEESPTSLETRTSYRGQDVYDALMHTFSGKCYICEDKGLTSINIEHLSPHENDVDLKYAWENLCLACSRCNNIKGHRFNNLIDCTNPSQDAFLLVKLLPPRMPDAKVRVYPMEDSDSVNQTAELLDRVFNSKHTIEKAITGEELRRRIFKKAYKILEHQNTYFDDESPQADKDIALERLKVLMKKEQAFSAFLRWLVIESPMLAELLEGEMD